MITESSSGFTNNITAEVNGNMPVDRQFHDIHEIYVSEHGHTRLLYATRYGKRYTLKCLKAEFLYTPLYRQILTKEFEIGLQLEHPNICHTMGMENVDGYGPAIIMEYIDGLTLQQFIDNRQLTRPLAWAVLRQLMDALAYMHSKGIYHRDLKPQNIMLTHRNHDLRLIDFSLSDSEAFSALKSPAGTMRYIAPEQLKHGAVANASADIYSLGKVVEDMAEDAGDRRLMRLGRTCANPDQTKRPASIDEVGKVISDGRLRPVVSALLIACALLALIIVAGLQRRTAATSKPAATYQTIYNDSNEVVDMPTFKKMGDSK